MKIRTKLAVRYTAATAAVFLFLMLGIYFFSEHSRSEAFFRDLKKEAITKVNLFLENRVDAATMQSIYMNNREFINEVEVAIYDTDFHLLYHDAREIDIVKETPDMIKQILAKKSIEFYQDHYQAIGMEYLFHGKRYVITAMDMKT